MVPAQDGDRRDGRAEAAFRFDKSAGVEQFPVGSAGSQAEWRAENAAAIASSNACADAFGLPLARYRLF